MILRGSASEIRSRGTDGRSVNLKNRSKLRRNKREEAGRKRTLLFLYPFWKTSFKTTCVA